MGRGSDTRMYAPRSESSQMYSSANEDESKYNPTSPEDNEKRAEAKKLKEEEAKKKAKDIKHIKIKPNQARVNQQLHKVIRINGGSSRREATRGCLYTRREAK